MRIMKWLGYGASAIIIVALIAVLLVAISPLVAGRDPSRPSFIGGYAPIVVLGGSMEPTYHIGSILFVQQVDPADIAAGDIITFDTPMQPGQPPSLTTHRVTSIDRTDGVLAFHTQGDANNTEDTWVVPADTIVGRGSFSIPYVGYISSFVRSRTGFALLVVIPALIIIGSESASIFRQLRRRAMPEEAR